jgi:cation transport ATPase
MNECDDDEKKNKKEKNYKNVFEISFSTSIIAIIIVIIIIIINIVIIIIEENVYRFKDFNTLFICFVESFIFVSFLKKEIWKKILQSKFEENLRKKFVYVVYFFAEFVVLENVHFDCEFCDSILILSLLFIFEFVAFSIFSSILENFVNENQSSKSFFFRE